MLHAFNSWEGMQIASSILLPPPPHTHMHQLGIHVHTRWIIEERLRTSDSVILEHTTLTVTKINDGWSEVSTGIGIQCIVVLLYAVECDWLNVWETSRASVWKFTSIIILVNWCVILYILNISSILSAGILCLKLHCHIIIFMHNMARGIGWEVVRCCQWAILADDCSACLHRSIRRIVPVLSFAFIHNACCHQDGK